MATTTPYVEILAPIRPKNGANFPVVYAENIALTPTNDMRLSQLLGDVNTNLSDYVSRMINDTIDAAGGIDERLDTIEQSLGISTGAVHGSINERISLIEESLGLKADTTTTSNISDRLAAVESALATKASTSVTNSIVTRLSSAESAIGTKADNATVTTLTGRVSTLETNLSKKADTTTTSALAARITSLETSVGSGGTVESKINSAVNTEKTARENADTALTNRVITLENYVGSGGTVESKIASAVNTEKSARESADAALTNRVVTLENNVGSGGTVESKIASAVNSEKSARENADTALASRVTSTETSITNINSSITTLNNKVANMTGSAKFVNSVDAMTDPNFIYILNTTGTWYSYDSTSKKFVSRGNVAGISIDPSLTQEGTAADAAAVGQSIISLQNEIDGIKTSSTNYLKTIETDNGNVLAVVDEEKTLCYLALTNGDFYASGAISNDVVKFSSGGESDDIAIEADSEGNVLSYYDGTGARHYSHDVHSPNINAIQEQVDDMAEAIEILKSIHSI